VGLIDTLDSLDLSDDVKAQLRREHEQEVTNLSDENATLKAKDRRDSVEQEVQDLAAIGLEEAPGLLKFYRRVLLSDDEEPGAVLLSDDEMNLSGDQATGAKGKEEISVAGALRQFVSLLPRNQEGMLNLSDQALAGNSGDPTPTGETPDEDTARQQRRESAAGWMGRNKGKKKAATGGGES
jgi:hypothetical protein